MGQRKRSSWVAAAMVAMAARSAVSAPPATAPAQTPPTRNTAATRPASTRPTTIPSTLTLTFKDTPIDTVLDYLSRTLGFEVIKDGPIDARVNIVSKQPVSPEEAITLVNAALTGNGFIAIRDGRILRVIPREKAKKGNVPVHFGSDPQAIADNDEMITQVVPIQNVSATKLKDELKGFMGDAEVGANDASNSLIITDNSSAIRRIVEIIAKLDEHEAETSEIRIVRLLHANASATAKLIDTFFKPAAGGGGPQMNPQQMAMMQQQGQPVPPQGGSGRHGATVVTAADDRTNTLLVMASTSSLKIIDDIIKNVDADLTSPAEEVQMRAFPLKYAAAEDTAKLINSVFKPARNNNDDFFFFFPRNTGEDKTNLHINAAFDLRTNTLIVTGSPEGLRQVEKLVETLDANPMASAELQVYHLKHANAFTVQGMIEDMFKPKSDSQPRYGYYYYMSEQANPQQNSKISVNVTSDDRTNTLIVTAPADLLKVIGKVVEELDTDPTTEDTLFIYHLRNAQSQNVEYVLNVLFGNVQGANENNQQNQNGQNGQNQQNQNNRFSNNATRSNNSFGSSNNGNGSSNGSINRSYNNNQNRQGQNGANPAKAENELSGKALVVADPDTNSLLVTTASKYEKQVRKIIEDLDRPVPQVLIKVLVAEVTHDNSADLGTDFSVLNQRPSGKGLSINSAFGNASATPGVLVTVVESNITATLHALAQKDKLDVLSRPYILASDNQLANIFIGSTVPFVTNSQITEAGQLINTVQYQDIGLNLNVTPHINPDGVVILDVNPAVQQLTSQSIEITANTSSPVISKRSADSRIAVLDGQTIVIGGMMEDRKTSTISRIPFLGDIPVVGALFSRTQVTKTKTELLIFLTPHVAQKPDVLQPMSEDESKGWKLTPEAVQPGTWEEQMKGMHRGAIPQTQPIKPANPVNSIDLSDQPDRQPIHIPATAPSTDSPPVR